MSAIIGLNDEQTKYLTDHYSYDDASDYTLFEWVVESMSDDYENHVYELNRDSHRWWDEYIQIVRVGDRFFGFDEASTTGDDSPDDVGFEREEWIKEYTAQEVTVTTYVEKTV